MVQDCGDNNKIFFNFFEKNIFESVDALAQGLEITTNFYIAEFRIYFLYLF